MASRRQTVLPGTVLSFRVKRAIVTTGVWKTPEQMWKDVDPFGDEEAFMRSTVKLTKNKNDLFVTLPTKFVEHVSDVDEGLDDGERVVNVEVTGHFLVANHRSVVTQLLQALKRQPDDTFLNDMNVSFHVHIPLELSGEWNMDTKEDDETDETDEEDVEHMLSRVLAKDESEVADIESRKRSVEQVLEGRSRRRRTTRREGEALPANMSDRVYVGASTVPGAGQGLFANMDFLPGDTVVWIGSPTLVDRDFKKAAKAKGFPRDSFFHIEKRSGALKQHSGRLFVMDGDFKEVDKPPLWYLINHGGQTANLKFDDDPERNEFKWVAKQPIAKDDELFFNYNPGEKTTFHNEQKTPTKKKAGPPKTKEARES